MYDKNVSDINELHSEQLVDTKWVEKHIEDCKVRIFEVDYEPGKNYYVGHIPGSVLIRWREDLNNSLIRDELNRIEYQNLLKSRGVNDDTTIVWRL